MGNLRFRLVRVRGSKSRGGSIEYNRLVCGNFDCTIAVNGSEGLSGSHYMGLVMFFVQIGWRVVNWSF